ncbi:hypothetical protein QBC45DRAFT_179742 [Copromyces sp. CBS 386.78]|nr:hypothetical protein QBC45DRAFT_179742 [Copromyces sp. CBS 386.78]
MVIMALVFYWIGSVTAVDGSGQTKKRDEKGYRCGMMNLCGMIDDCGTEKEYMRAISTYLLASVNGISMYGHLKRLGLPSNSTKYVHLMS